jgi:hypothetical protein
VGIGESAERRIAVNQFSREKKNDNGHLEYGVFIYKEGGRETRL